MKKDYLRLLPDPGLLRENVLLKMEPSRGEKTEETLAMNEGLFVGLVGLVLASITSSASTISFPLVAILTDRLQATQRL